MQADTKHVDTEPREAGHNIAEKRHDHQAALPNESAPARVQNDCTPEDDQHRPVFFRVPSPETSPGLVGPDPAKDGADKTEQRSEANDAVGHARQRIGSLLL